MNYISEGSVSISTCNRLKSTLTYDSHFKVHMVQNVKIRHPLWWVYKHHVAPFDWLFLWLWQSFVFVCFRPLKLSDPDKIDATMLKDLQSKVAALKSEATGGIIPPTGTTQGGDEPSQGAQLPHASGTRDIKAPPAKKERECGRIWRRGSRLQRWRG